MCTVELVTFPVQPPKRASVPLHVPFNIIVDKGQTSPQEPPQFCSDFNENPALSDKFSLTRKLSPLRQVLFNNSFLFLDPLLPATYARKCIYDRECCKYQLARVPGSIRAEPDSHIHACENIKTKV
jgi:hypothetical protein